MFCSFTSLGRGKDEWQCNPSVTALPRVRAPESSEGAVTDSYEYDAFGNSFTVSGSTPNSYLYRGEYFDSDLSLYYLRARWMNPLTGRFMSRDPNAGVFVAPISLHLDCESAILASFVDCANADCLVPPPGSLPGAQDFQPSLAFRLLCCRCSRTCSGQSTLNVAETTEFNRPVDSKRVLCR